MQQNDQTLSTFLQRAGKRELENEPDEMREEYFLQNGVLYHQHGQVKQLVVQQAAQDEIFTLGHSILLAGHLGNNKTTAHIKRHFHWPGFGQ